MKMKIVNIYTSKLSDEEYDKLIKEYENILKK